MTHHVTPEFISRADACALLCCNVNQFKRKYLPLLRGDLRNLSQIDGKIVYRKTAVQALIQPLTADDLARRSEIGRRMRAGQSYRDLLAKPGPRWKPPAKKGKRRGPDQRQPPLGI